MSMTAQSKPRKQKAFLRNLLLHRFEWMEEQVLQRAAEANYQFITPAMNRLFAHMWGQPVGLSDLSRRLGITRQAVHKVASDAARHGLVEFVESTVDARVVMLRFTEKGWAMSDSASRDFEAIETALIKKIGAENVHELKRILSLAWGDNE